MLPGNLYLDNTKAPMEAINICPAVPATVINTVLKRYLENGTHDFPRSTNRSWKLSMVGFLTKNLGGYMNISSIGLKALFMAYTIGIAMNTANRPKNV